MSIGPTGQFPRGKFSADDEGELALTVSHQDKTVILNFGKSITWFGLDADTAIGLAELLISHARQCGSTRPLTFTLDGKTDTGPE